MRQINIKTSRKQENHPLKNILILLYILKPVVIFKCTVDNNNYFNKSFEPNCSYILYNGT